MIYLILFSFFLTSSLCFIWIFQKLFLSEQRLEKRMQHYFSLENKKINRKPLNFSLKIQSAKESIRKRILTKEKNSKLETKLARAGVSLKPEEFVLFQWIVTSFSGCLFVLLSGNWFFFIIGVILGLLVPKWYLRRKERQRLERFNEGLPDMITTIVGSLRAGFSFLQALKSVVEEAVPPIKGEMETVLQEMQYGKSLEDSLNDLKARMPSEDLDLMIQAILIQRQVGGNLATVLDKIVETIRDRTKIQRQITTLTAQGRLSGMVVGLLPLILGLVIYIIQPSYIHTLFSNPIGLGMLIAGTISGVIGFLLIKKLTTIEV